MAAYLQNPIEFFEKKQNLTHFSFFHSKNSKTFKNIRTLIETGHLNRNNKYNVLGYSNER